MFAFALVSLVLYSGAALAQTAPVKTCLDAATDAKVNSGGFYGAYIPQCTSSGTFRPRQCWGSTGSCWCVDIMGKELDGTRNQAGQEKIECEEHEMEDSCQGQLMKAQSKGLVGSYIPQCKNDGSWVPKQCWGSTGSCWCVDSVGEKIEEMYVGPDVTCPGLLPAGGSINPAEPATNSDVVAPAVPTSSTANSDCLQKKQEGLDQQGFGYAGQFIPSCNPDGSYSSMQCWGSTGQCWCSDPMGNEILGSKSNPGQDLPECSDFHEAKEVDYEDAVVVPQIVAPGTVESCPDKVTRMASSGLVGAYIPQCNADGSYSPMQCWGSTGSCWCVDSHGKEVLGTKTTAGEDAPKCGAHAYGGHVKPIEIELESCTEQLEEISEEAGIGTYIPQCKRDGTWEETQCWGSTGQCWCVNRMTGVKLGPKTGVGAGHTGLNCASPLLQRAHVKDTQSTSSDFGQKEAFFLGGCVASLILAGIYMVASRREKNENDYQEYLDVESVKMEARH